MKTHIWAALSVGLCLGVGWPRPVSGAGEIRGNKWYDANSNGVWDAGEQGMQGWKIYVDLNTNQQWDASEPYDVSDVNGGYTISVAPGTCLVSEVMKSGWNRTFPEKFRGAGAGELRFVQMVWDNQGGMDALCGPYSVAVSSDGSNLYIAAAYDNALAVFARNPLTGGLAYIQRVRDGSDGVDGLAGVRSVTVSPDGRHVYAAGYDDYAVAVFGRNPTNGQLTYVHRVRDGVDGVDGLEGVNAVTVSLDGGHVYAAGLFGDAVAVFSRDTASGRLTYLQMVKDGVGGVDGLSRATSVTVTPDGRHVYTAGWGDNAVALFNRNLTSGRLTYVHMVKDGVNGVDGLGGVRCVMVSPDGKHMYAAAENDDAVTVFSRNPTNGQLTYVQILTNEVDGADGLSKANSVTVSPDGGHAYATGIHEDAVAVYSRNPTNGRLTHVQMVKDGVGGVDGLDGARSVMVSPDGEHVYAIGLNDHAVATFSRNPMNGQLTHVQVVKDDVGGLDGLDEANEVTVSPDGRHVYVAGKGDDHAIVVFDRHEASGKLTYVDMVQDGVNGVQGIPRPREITVSLDGRHLYVASGPSYLAVFNRDAASGRLTYVHMVKDQNVSSVTVSPDGRHVYAAGVDAVAVFSRDPTSGQLTYVGMVKDGVDGVDGLLGANSVTVSPDDRHVYTAGRVDHAVAVFNRNPTNGRLTYVHMVKDGVGGVDGLNGAYSVRVSPDGTHVYAAGFSDHAVAVFSRNPTNGRLAYVHMVKDGVGGVDGLRSASSVTVSPDGGHVYATGISDAAVAVFSRDPANGRLTYVQMVKDGVDGVDGLYEVCSVMVSPDGGHVYVTGSFDNAVVVFTRDSLVQGSHRVRVGPQQTVANINFGNSHPDLRLTVAVSPHTSSHGGALPPTGTNTFPYGSYLGCVVTNSPMVVGGTQYVCVAATVEGNDFAQVSPTNVTLTLTNDATLTWQWQTNYWLEVEAGPGGGVRPANTWTNAGSGVRLTAQPDRYYHFVRWSDSGTNRIVVGDCHACTVTVAVTLPLRLVASFAENLVTNGTPQRWLAVHGWTSNLNSVALHDHDGDGAPTWAEFHADTIPTNAESVLAITGVVRTANGLWVLWKGGTGAWQRLETRAALMATPERWAVLFSNRPPTSVSTNYLHGDATNGVRFYRLRAWREEPPM